MSEKLTIEEFAESYYEEHEGECYCNATDFPPCGFCESSGQEVDKQYEDYLRKYEEEKSNE